MMSEYHKINGKLKQNIHFSTSPIWSLAVSWESTLLAAGGEDSLLVLFDIRYACHLPSILLNTQSKIKISGPSTSTNDKPGTSIEREITYNWLLPKNPLRNANPNSLSECIVV